MSDELMNKEVENAELEKIKKIETAIENLETKKSKFMFFVPESKNPAASIYEVYFQATVVKKMGFDVTMLVEKGDYEPPTWIEKELVDHEHLPMADTDLTVSPDTVMVIPEVFSNIMEQTKNLPCMRVGLLQSLDYMYNSLIPGTDWTSFGIGDVITTSPILKELMGMLYNNKFNIKTYKIGIPDYFKRTDEPQKPVISIMGRNPNEISKLVKMFYSKYPNYNWVTFDPMLTKSKPPQSMRRVDFANRLRGNFAAIWVDRISSFGTFPLECMKSGVIPIALRPDVIPEYMIERDEEGKGIKTQENVGVWADNFYDLPVLIGDTITRFLDDSISEEMYDKMEKVASEYTEEISEKSIIETYSNLINERIALLRGALPVEELK